MKPIHVSNLDAMIGRWQAKIDDLEITGPKTQGWRKTGVPDYWGQPYMYEVAAYKRCISDLRTEIQREQDRQVELEEGEK